MALTRPTLISTAAFDATQQHTFTFNVVGGSQVVANQLVIRNNVTNDIVYTKKQESYRYEHILEANILTNGIYYNAVLSTFDADGNESQVSVPIQFYCYTTPVVQFTNIPVSGIIPNASFSFEFTYTQAENEKLNSYVVKLYNSFQSLVSTSGIQYASDGTPPYSGSYLFAGFEDNAVYYVELVGITVNNTQITTGLVKITVTYTQPDLFALIGLDNNCSEGYITLKSNIVLIEGESIPSPPTYVDGGNAVDLTNPNSWVEWNNGYSVSGNFLARAWFRDPTNYSTIIQFSNVSGETIRVNFMLGYENDASENLQAYVEAIVSVVDGEEYYIFSNYIDILTDTEYYNVWLTNSNNIYQIQLAAV